MWKYDLVLYLCWITDQKEVTVRAGSQMQLSAPRLGSKRQARARLRCLRISLFYVGPY